MLRSSEEKFIKDILARVGRVDDVTLASMKLAYELIREQMEIRLVKERKPVDLCFCTLHPLPYRAGWKSQMYEAAPKAIRTIRGQPLAMIKPLMQFLGLRAQMFFTAMMAFNKRDGTIHWGLEVQPRSRWWRLSMREERRLINMTGPGGYYEHIRRHISAAADRLLEVYIGWAKTLTLPVAAVSNHRNEDRFCWKAAKRNHYVPEAVVVDNGANIAEVDRAKESLAAKAKNVRKMPNLPEAYKFVRVAGGE